MVNPILTILFDLVLVGTAIAVIAALVAEQRSGHRSVVGDGAGDRLSPRDPSCRRPAYTVGTRTTRPQVRRRPYVAARRRATGSPVF